MDHVTVGTVVNVDVHGMMLFYLHTAGDGQEMRLEPVCASSNVTTRNSLGARSDADVEACVCNRRR